MCSWMCMNMHVFVKMDRSVFNCKCIATCKVYFLFNFFLRIKIVPTCVDSFRSPDTFSFPFRTKFSVFRLLLTILFFEQTKKIYSPYEYCAQSVTSTTNSAFMYVNLYNTRNKTKKKQLKNWINFGPRAKFSSPIYFMHFHIDQPIALKYLLT